jgi:hypothetical protein
MSGPITFPPFPDNPDPGGSKGGFDNVTYIPHPTLPTPTIQSVAVAELREPHDGPTQQVFIDLGPLCGGPRIFKYFERTYFNVVRVDSIIKAYGNPVVTWAIDGQPVSNGTITVPATWDRPPGAATVPSKPASALLATETIGPFPVNTDLPLKYEHYHDQHASLRVRMGPDAGNVTGYITISVQERYEPIPPEYEISATQEVNYRTSVAYLDVINQEIILDQASRAAFMNCERIKHLVDQREQAIGPPHPADPDHLEERVRDAIDELIAAELTLTQLAAQVAEHRPELAAALSSLWSAPSRR